MKPPLQKYPIGIQDFREIREGGFVYVDKTQLVHQLAVTGKYYFLSRPRRFGKSLLMSVMKELFEGSRELFEGLWIEDQWDWDKKWPVIHLPFASSGFQNVGLERALHNMLLENAERLGVRLEHEDFSGMFMELIRKTAQKGQKVVILVDEYDKPLLEYLENDNIEQAEKNRNILRSFYSVIKDNDANIKFFFMTGVSRFAKMSLFSELNNLRSISLSPQYSDLLGITQAELVHYFPERLAEIAGDLEMDYADLLARAKDWYNGYSWKGKHKVYNPFSLLNFLQNKDFQNYWFSTGSPRLLIRTVRNEGLYNPSGIYASETDLESFDFEGLGAISLLFQAGYLTIIEYYGDDQVFRLDYPNQEVRRALNEFLLRDLTGDNMRLGLPTVSNMARHLRTGDLAGLIELFNQVFASLPYDHWPQKGQRGESFFHALFHVMFTLLGTYVQSEVHSAKGRCDAVVTVPGAVYVFEFKVDEPVGNAIAQIRERDYLAPYRGTGAKCVAVGVSLSSRERGVQAWETFEE